MFTHSLKNLLTKNNEWIHTKLQRQLCWDILVDPEMICHFVCTRTDRNHFGFAFNYLSGATFQWKHCLLATSVRTNRRLLMLIKKPPPPPLHKQTNKPRVVCSGILGQRGMKGIEFGFHINSHPSLLLFIESLWMNFSFVLCCYLRSFSCLPTKQLDAWLIFWSLSTSLCEIDIKVP